MPTCYIMRGIPGSGKSTHACGCGFPPIATVSADHYFCFIAQGVKQYTFDHKHLAAAHAYCWYKFEVAVAHGINVVVDNTNTRLWEFQKYIDRAEKCGYTVQVIRCVAPIEDCIKRQVHGVPAEYIRRMAERFEDYPGETIVNTGELV